MRNGEIVGVTVHEIKGAQTVLPIVLFPPQVDVLRTKVVVDNKQG